MNDLEQARRGDGSALKRADEQLHKLSNFALVYREWYRGL